MSVPDIQNALHLLENEEVDAAISTLEATVDELPAHLPAQILLARAYETNEQWDDALRTWETARFLMPNSPTVNTGRKRALQRLEQETEDSSEASPPPASESPRSEVPSEPSSPEPVRPEVSGAETTDASEVAEAPSHDQTDADDEAQPAPSAETDPSGAGRADPTEPAAKGPDEDTVEKDAEPGPDESGIPDAPTPSSFGSEGPSGLDDLRQRAEQEARQGGSRPGLTRQQEAADEPSSDAADDAETSEEREADETDEVTGDLDRLIRELESARIEPTPDPDESDEDHPDVDLDDDIDDLVSETLARIYAGQGQYREAARIYVKLASQEPSKARHHLQNASEMREKADAEEAEQTNDSR